VRGRDITIILFTFNKQYTLTIIMEREVRYKAKLAEQAERFDEMVTDRRTLPVSRIDRRRAQLLPVALQERDWLSSCVLACGHQHRAEG
jgi:hypothetical protein